MWLHHENVFDRGAKIIKKIVVFERALFKIQAQ